MPIDLNLCKMLIDAAASGDLKKVEKLSVRDDVDVNYSPLFNDAEIFKYTGSALYQAIEKGQKKVAEFLINHAETDLDAYDMPVRSAGGGDGNLNALCHAIHKDLSDIAMGILDKGASMSPICSTGRFEAKSNALGHAIVAENEELVDRLASLWVKENSTEFDFAEDLPVLHCAIRFSSPQILRILLQHGADPNEVDAKTGTTPLEYAIEEARAYPDLEGFPAPAYYEVLLEHGANISFKHYLLMNPEVADFISKNNLPEEMGALLNDGFDINFKGVLDITPLMVASANDDFVMMGEMVKKGADITAVNQLGRTAFAMGVHNRPAGDKENSGFSCDESLEPLPHAQVRSLSMEADDEARKKPYSEVQDDENELVQLQMETNLPHEQNIVPSDAQYAASESASDSRDDTDEKDCSFDPAKMDYHGI